MVWVCWPPRWPPDLVKYSHGPRCWRQPRGQRPIVQGWPFRLRRARRRCRPRCGIGWQSGFQARWPTLRRRLGSAAGFDFWVYGLHFAGVGLPERWGAPLVARIAAMSSRFLLLERESRLQGWVAEQGYPAPAVLELVPPGEWGLGSHR
jgi:hypothetical protein